MGAPADFNLDWFLSLLLEEALYKLGQFESNSISEIKKKI